MRRSRLRGRAHRWLRTATLPSVGLISLITACGWFGRHLLHRAWKASPALLPATILGAAMWVLCIVALLWVRRCLGIRAYLSRTESWTRMSSLKGIPDWLGWLGERPDLLELVCGPVLRTDWGRNLTAHWRQSGFGRKGSRLFALLLGSGALGAITGYRIGGAILGLALALTLPLLPYNVVRHRAEVRARRFGHQVPAALDSIAAGLAAGLSFQRAIGYSVEELSEPIRSGFLRLGYRMRLGHSVEDALHWFLRQYPEDGMRLAVEGIILQRRLGGDLVALLEESAALVRDRMELEREVQAVTAQGRLSGWVIAALVPVSATLLLTTNPEYVDILFETVIGQVLLVVALALQLIGWGVISRLIRVEY